MLDISLISHLVFTQARVAAEGDRQMLLKDYESLQKAYKELKARESSLLEDQVC